MELNFAQHIPSLPLPAGTYFSRSNPSQSPPKKCCNSSSEQSSTKFLTKRVMEGRVGAGFPSSCAASSVNHCEILSGCGRLWGFGFLKLPLANSAFNVRPSGDWCGVNCFPDSWVMAHWADSAESNRAQPSCGFPGLGVERVAWSKPGAQRNQQLNSASETCVGMPPTRIVVSSGFSSSILGDVPPGAAEW